ncbi:MAG: hypothetical protein KGJ51_10985, partial [Acidobacteriota bacterium]|nr:hypothetical protein [Acidobacteriota bacterium]
PGLECHFLAPAFCAIDPLSIHGENARGRWSFPLSARPVLTYAGQAPLTQFPAAQWHEVDGLA